MEDKLQDEVERARRAKEILDNELFKEAMEAIRAECQKAWEETKSDQTERRERIWMMLKVAEKFRLNIESYLNDGTLAQAKIAELDEEEKRRRLLGLF